MTPESTCEVFGQAVPTRRLGQMARQIASGMDKSRRVTFAGYVWYRPQVLIGQNPHTSSEEVYPERQQVA